MNERDETMMVAAVAKMRDDIAAIRTILERAFPESHEGKRWLTTEEILAMEAGKAVESAPQPPTAEPEPPQEAKAVQAKEMRQIKEPGRHGKMPMKK